MTFRVMVLAWVSALGCSSGHPVDDDLGPVDPVVAEAERYLWPGIDRGPERAVRLHNGFGGDRSMPRWILSATNRSTGDAYWFCRRGDSECPVDAHHRLNWDRLVGSPVFSSVPGMPGYAPFWRVWRVVVPSDYEANAIKTSNSVAALVADDLFQMEALSIDFGEIFGQSIGMREALVHAPLVLTGTTLDGNGELLPDGETPMMSITTQHGWADGYRVEFFDFSAAEGLFAAADDSEARPMMPAATLYALLRECAPTVELGVCGLVSAPETAYVDEANLRRDITGDGDLDDTNNIIGGVPCEAPLFPGDAKRPREPNYSPLRTIYISLVAASASADIDLIDTSGDQQRSDIRSVRDLFASVDTGAISEPELWLDQDVILLDAPTPVPAGFQPYPCTSSYRQAN